MGWSLHAASRKCCCCLLPCGRLVSAESLGVCPSTLNQKPDYTGLDSVGGNEWNVTLGCCQWWCRRGIGRIPHGAIWLADCPKQWCQLSILMACVSGSMRSAARCRLTPLSISFFFLSASSYVLFVVHYCASAEGCYYLLSCCVSLLINRIRIQDDPRLWPWICCCVKWMKFWK